MADTLSQVGLMNGPNHQRIVLKAECNVVTKHLEPSYLVFGLLSMRKYLWVFYGTVAQINCHLEKERRPLAWLVTGSHSMADTR